MPRWEGVRARSDDGRCVRAAANVGGAVRSRQGGDERGLSHPGRDRARQSLHKAPVMVWIHGGTLIWGSGASSPMYDGHAFAKRGVVSGFDQLSSGRARLSGASGTQQRVA
ncbi:carboxylesterase family protein [Caulobacter segnis]